MSLDLKNQPKLKSRNVDKLICVKMLFASETYLLNGGSYIFRYQWQLFRPLCGCTCTVSLGHTDNLGRQ